ncbi:amidohydrolase family protein, partial [Acetivibrio cellulolyticus]|uniref:amidohydrolase family protein n=1 Tax=Acetivibrio cellulolyticus TaxID=35830 RepID=UPI0002481AB3
MEKLDRNGKNTTYEYDCHGRMISQFTGDSSTYVQITVPNESTDMGYDGNGNLKKIIVETKENGVLKSRVTTQRIYDELNRVKTKTETSVDANNNTIVMGQLAKRAKIEARLDGTVNNIKESMKKAGIDKSVVLSIATKPSQTEKINTWSSCIQDDSIVAFGSVHPENENWKDELLRLKEMGIKGIKLHPDYQKFFVDDKKMYPIYELAVDLGLVILFHAGMDIGLPY